MALVKLIVDFGDATVKMNALTRAGRPAAGKSKQKLRPTQFKDWHALLGNLALKAEKATDSLERMLAVCRAVVAFLTQLLRPGVRYQDTPSVILGQHYLSHRELGAFHRGDLTRVYLQELCSYDPVEAPIPSGKYSNPGHTDIALWNLNFVPTAQAKQRKEGIIGSGLPYLEVALVGGGAIEFPRHAEKYTFTLPSLILTSPLNEECPLDYEGTIAVECPATGLRTVLKFKPWQEGTVKGEVRKFAGEGEMKIARIDGRWQTQIVAHGLENSTEGTLYDTADFPPELVLPPVINLTSPGPQTVPRFWSSVIEAALYVDTHDADKAGKAAGELAASLPEGLRAALLYTTPEGPLRATQPKYDDEESKLAAKDPRPVPPASRVQRALGRALRYQLQYLVQSVNQQALEEEIEEMRPSTKSGSLAAMDGSLRSLDAGPSSSGGASLSS